MQRFVWDLKYPNPPTDQYDLPISAIVHDTPWVPEGPAVLPGVYNVKLTVDGKTYSQKLTVRMDPRVKTPPAGLRLQYDLSMRAYNGQNRAMEMMEAVTALQKSNAAKRVNADAAQKAQLDMSDAKIKTLLSGPQRKPGEPSPPSEMPLERLAGSFNGLLDLLQDADVTPSAQALAGSKDIEAALAKAEAAWKEISAMPLTR
jgi:hypothetical protein